MKNPQLAPEIREYIANGQTDELLKLCAAAHPADVAASLSALEAAEARTALQTCAPELGAEIFSHLDVDLQVALSETLGREELAGLLSEMSPDDRVDLIQQLPATKRETVLGAMARAEREDVRRLSSYEEGTAGAVMTSDYVSLPPGITAAEAIARLRLEAPDRETIYYAYVVDGLRRLVGFASLKDLILARQETQIADIMNREVIFAHAGDDQEDVARMIQKYDLLALPVVNGDGVLVGIVTHDDALDIIIQEQTEDIEKLMAIGGPHEPGMYLRTPAWAHFRKRVVWIVVLAALGLVSGFIVQSFEGLLLQFAILATFMPMLADTGGNTGSQSATLVVRALALKEIRPADVLRVMAKELTVALPLGLVLSALALARVALFTSGSALPPGISPLTVGIAVATALGLQVVTSTLIGAVLPLLAARFRVDPAVVASPALTTVVDITGLLLYFVTVKLMLGA
jgi:magnesium transporter